MKLKLLLALPFKAIRCSSVSNDLFLLKERIVPLKGKSPDIALFMYITVIYMRQIICKLHILTLIYALFLPYC